MQAFGIIGAEDAAHAEAGGRGIGEEELRAVAAVELRNGVAEGGASELEAEIAPAEAGVEGLGRERERGGARDGDPALGDDEGARDAEEKRLGGADGLRGPRVPEAKVGILDDIVHIAHGGKGAAQIGAQVRLHFLGEPFGKARGGQRGVVGVGRHRDGAHAMRKAISQFARALA